MLHEEALHPRAGVRQLRITMGEENQPESQAEDQQPHRLKRIERLHEKSSAILCTRLFRTLVDFSRKAKPSPAPAASVQFQVQSLANHKEQRVMMTKLGTIGHHHPLLLDRKSTRLNSSHLVISYAVFCLKKKKGQELERVEGEVAEQDQAGLTAEGARDIRCELRSISARVKKDRNIGGDRLLDATVNFSD